MKNLITAIISLSIACATYAQFTFDGKEYSKQWEGAQGDASMIEFLTEGETKETWSTMLTLQAHSKAKELKEVSGPYYEARKSIVAMQPKVHPKEKGGASDSVLELFLGAPGVTPHIEFVLARFIQSEHGVHMITYSHKIPLKSKKKNQNINVNDVMNNKDSWIKELLEFSPESIRNEF